MLRNIVICDFVRGIIHKYALWNYCFSKEIWEWKTISNYQLSNKSYRLQYAKKLPVHMRPWEPKSDKCICNVAKIVQLLQFVEEDQNHAMFQVLS